MALSAQQKKQFRSLGHGLKPVVTVAGNGLSEGVLAEAERALEDHELIKVKIAVADRDARKECIEELCSNTNAELVQEIGKIALIFRQAKQRDERKSNLR